MRFHEINLLKNKRLGVFYTPHNTAESLAGWAVRTGHERILEPSVGGGALLLAALSRAKELTGRENSISGLGCDVDSRAIGTLRSIVPTNIKLHLGDFLDVPTNKHTLFDVVLANPPFTRNHTIPKKRRDALRARLNISGAAGLWVHFLLHASNFLLPGGRLVSIVPRSALFTRYAEDLMARMAASFDTVKAAEIPERPAWIGNADEMGAILFAEGYRTPSPQKPRTSHAAIPKYVRQTANRSIPPCYQSLLDQSRTLSSIADLNIGAVTGCNSVFLLNEAERLEAAISLSDVYPIVSRSAQARGLRITRQNLASLAKVGHKTWLLAPSKLSEPVRRRLAAISQDQRKAVSWLKRRTPWWRVERGNDCDAVFTYMNDWGPRLVLAGPGIICTNTLHRVVFKEGTCRNQQLASSVTLVSTFGQLAAELKGRMYGGGVLKFELTETRLLPVLPFCDEIERAFGQINKLVRDGNMDEARAIADHAIVRPCLGPGWQTGLSEMEAAIKECRIARGRNEKRSPA
jgi:hypothetical protein